MKSITSLLQAVLDSDNFALVWLFEIQVNSTTTVYLSSTPDRTIDFMGNTYSPREIHFSQMKETSTGEVPSVSVSITDADQVWGAYLVANNGLLGNPFKITLITMAKTDGVWAVYDAPNSKLENKFYITNALWDREDKDRVVHFTLKPKLAYEREQIPRRLHQRNVCRWRHRSRECGDVSDEIVGPNGERDFCSRSLSDSVYGCTAHNNTARFGGFPSLPEGPRERL